MSTVGKPSDFGDTRNRFSAATFRKVLKGFEIGGLPYTEVQFQLKRLLATGVSPMELREVLRRNELIEPMPEYAYREVLGVLDEAIEQDAALQTDPDGAIEPEEELDPATFAAKLQETRDALESEQTRAREAEEALSERMISEEAVRSRLDITLRESERYQAELRAARASIASRDKVTAQMRQMLDDRDGELARVRREHEAELQALRVQAAAAATELAASRAALERSLTDGHSLSGAVRESLATRDKSLAEMRQTQAERDARFAKLQHELASQGKSLAEMRQTLAERDAQLATLRHEQGNAVGESEGRAQRAEEKLQAAQRRVDELKLELRARHDAIAAGTAQVRNLQSQLRDNNSLIEKLGASVRSEAKRAAQWQAAAQQPASQAAAIFPRAEVESPADGLPRVEVYPRVEDPPRVEAQPGVQGAAALRALPKFPVNVRGWRSNFRAPPRALWIGAAIVLLGTAIWFVAHRPSPVPSSPAASSAALIQPAVPPTVPPADQVDHESAATETGAAIEKPPPAATTPAAGKPVTAAAKPNTDLQRCRAGGIDACYDAIRWRPSDPSLLTALGDALLRANRPKDALRTYQRVAGLAPNLPGIAAKISAAEAKLSAKPAQRRASTHAAAGTQSH